MLHTVKIALVALLASSAVAAPIGDKPEFSAHHHSGAPHPSGGFPISFPVPSGGFPVPSGGFPKPTGFPPLPSGT
ncbi:hypothetical protein BU16DRAFT_564961 [Lophium mytilinum]|uniref:Uncharacterized protein n=1 Tax=Lophium mytilinum TaxID=390894 RepID=A0A6A6QKL6_9PEZI|nr:hypothetical protein BU16DRAFT_564961 [Lophium mytilinum]